MAAENVDVPPASSISNHPRDLAVRSNVRSLVAFNPDTTRRSCETSTGLDASSALLVRSRLNFRPPSPLRVTMPGPIESSGDIEIYCHPTNATSRGSVPHFERITPGTRLALLFIPGEMSPPYSLKIFSPSGQNILDTLVRDAPTGTPQSPPPIEFVVSASGAYRIEVRSIIGRQRGEAIIRVG